MAIIKRTYVNRRFTSIDTALLENKELSLKAKGLIAYLLSRPENWQIHMTQLTQVCSDGEASIRTAMNELISTGYVVRTRRRGEKGKLAGFDYEVRDIIEDIENEKNAIPANQAITRFSTNGLSTNGESTNGESINGESTNGKTIRGKTIRGKSRTNNKDNTNKESKKKDLTKKECVSENTHTPFFEKQETDTQDSPQASPKATQHHTFDQSPYSDFENFKNLLITLNFAQVDAEYYFKKISASCKSKGTKSKDFGAYIELWLNEDQTASKLKLSTQQASKPAVKTTTDYNPAQTITQKLDDMEAYAFKSGNATRQWCESAIQTLMQLFPQASPEEQQRIDTLGYNINELTQTLPPDKPAQDQPPTTNQRKRGKKNE